MVMHEIAFQAFHSRIEGAPLTLVEPTPLTLVERTDADFIAGLLADLATETGRASLREQEPEKHKDGAWELFQRARTRRSHPLPRIRPRISRRPCRTS